LRATCGDDRRVAVCRELTKLFEEVRRGTLGTIDVGEPRGEYVVVLAGADTHPDTVDDEAIRHALRTELASGSTKKDAVAGVSLRLGAPKKTVYAIAVTLGTIAGDPLP
jgi:16S rRNA (cytidine1402-2'-O)-methyltransferase